MLKFLLTASLPDPTFWLAFVEAGVWRGALIPDLYIHGRPRADLIRILVVPSNPKLLLGPLPVFLKSKDSKCV